FCGQVPQPAPQRRADPALGLLLQLVGESPDQQIAAETGRGIGAIQLAPGQSQLLPRPIEQLGNLAVDLGDILTARSVGPVGASTGSERRLARWLASRSMVARRRHVSAGFAMR